MMSSCVALVIMSSCVALVMMSSRIVLVWTAHPQGVLLHQLITNMEEAVARGKEGSLGGGVGPSLYLYSGHDR